jgi:hypothetical protein
MQPFLLESEIGATPETAAVHTILGLVYRVVHQGKDAVLSSLLYTFYTPLDFLQHPPTKSNGANDLPKELALTGPVASDISLLTRHRGKTSQLSESANDTEAPDGAVCQHDTPHVMLCMGVESGLASPFNMAVDHVGEVACNEIKRTYRPGQFVIVNDSSNNTVSKHIVGIRSAAMGPSKWFLAIVQDEKSGQWKFRAEVRRTDRRTDRSTDRCGINLIL